MARDEFKNLGFAEQTPKQEGDPKQKQITLPAEPEKGVKGELRW